jgi:hypothetical protein
MMDEDIEKGDENKDTKDLQKEGKQGMSQSSKDDIGVCVTILLITLLAIIVTSIKIVLLDMNGEYATLFGNNVTTTASPHKPAIENDNSDIIFS